MEPWKLGLIVGFVAFMISRNLQLGVILGLVTFGASYLPF